MSKNIDFHSVRNDLELFHISSVFNVEKKEYRNYLVLLIVCFCCLTVINISTCEAFYTLQERTKKITGNLSAEAMLDAISEMQYDLSVYHNTNSHQYKNSYISTKSSKMVPMIDLDIYSLQPVIRTEPLGSEQFVENLIYANLRVQILIEQYRQLHEMARKIKSMQWVPELGDSDKNYMRSQSSPNRIVQYGIHRVASELAFEAESLIRNPEATKNNRTLRSVGTMNANTDFLELNRSSSTQYSSAKNPSGFDSSDTGNGHGYQAGLKNQPPENLYKVYEKKNNGAPPKESELPWIFKLILTSFHYFMKNKIEGVVYLFMLLVLISVFTGAKR